MWVDNDVSNWFPTLNNFYWSPFSKWPPQYRTNSTLSDFNDISYVDRLWCPKFIPDIEKFLAVTIFKMAVRIQHCPISSKFDMWVDNDVPTLKNFYRSPFSKWPPQYCTNSTLSDFNDISYVGRLWCPELIPDIEIISIIVSKVFMSKACMVVSGISCHCIWTNTDYYNNNKRCLPASSKFLEIGLRS